MRSKNSVALLVDIENIQPSVALETAITQMFTTTEIIKIAVANWQLLKGIDKELLDRGYHLFHVPTGSNNADRELVNLGWMLKDSNELIIVSNDKYFIRFTSRLKSSGESISIIHYSQTQSAFVITKTHVLLLDDKQVTTKNAKEIKTQNSPLINVSGKPVLFKSQSQLITELKQLVSQKKSINSPAILASEFHKKFGVKASVALVECKSPVKFNEFILENKILIDSTPKEKLITEIRILINLHPDLAKDPGKLSNEFKKTHGVSISEKMKQLGILGKLSKFIAEIQPDRNCDRN
jgi:hypothetical protein